MEFDFSESQTVESLDGVPEDFHGLYKDTGDGKFVLDSEHAGVKSAVSAVTRLNVALKASRAEAKANKAGRVDLAPLADYGTDPETILEGFKTRLADATKAAKGKTSEDFDRQVDKIKQDLATAHSAEIEGLKTRNEALQGQLYNHMVTSTAKSALQAAGAIDPDLVMPHLERQIKVEEVEGKYEVQVIDAQKDLRYSGATGTVMSVQELVAEMKNADKFAALFKSEGKTGGGSPPTRKGVPSGGDRELSGTEKIAAGLAKHQYSSAGRGR